ncbi:MAG: helix-turn-helix transcriptional regulator [Clostridiales bacterium]|nr:helix-turn-helix transcriptional regulator [uncultured Blautia sp.]MBS6195183.1 helix-turn-helix transcriptional regulator [Clostridiales bacterium]
MRTEEYISMRLSELCRKRGYSKYRLSQLTGMSQTALGNILAEESIPTIPTLEKICDAFGISLAQFFAGDSGRLDLTEEQSEILEIWDGLETKEREILLSFIRSLKK